MHFLGLRVKFYAVMSEYLEGLLQVLHMVYFLHTFNDYIIHKFLHCPPYECHQDFVDKSLIDISSVI